MFPELLSMTEPLHPIVADLYSTLDENLREAFQERAGIMEFEAGQSRDMAECLAMLDVLRSHPLALLRRARPISSK